MRITIADPSHGTQICFDAEDNKVLDSLYGKKIGDEIDGASLGKDFEGYVFKIGGGHDKQGFTMKRGVLTPKRVRLLLKSGSSCYRPRCDGERKRKSVRGCILSRDTSAIHLVLLDRADGAPEIKGLTDESRPSRYGPKRARKIIELFGLDKDMEKGKTKDAKKLILSNVIQLLPKEGAKRYVKPKVQRLVTSNRISRKKRDEKLREQRAKRAKAREQAFKEKWDKLKPKAQ